MFKELFASIMLATACGTPSISIKQPKNAAYFNDNVLSGAYVFSDFFLYDAIGEDISDFTGIIDSSFNNESTYVYVGDISKRGNFNNNKNVYYDSFFAIDYECYQDANDTIVEFSFGDAVRTYTYQAAFASQDNIYYISTFDREFFENTIFYFDVDYSFSFSVEKNFFNMIFDRVNSNVSLYTGWYTFNRSLPNGYNLNLYGNFSVNNELTNYVQYIGGTSGFIYYNYDYLYQDATWKGNNQMYLTNFPVNEHIDDVMTYIGTFNYVPNNVESDFADLIFSIMDAPLYFITSLFSFELLGIQFYVAFMSLVTVLVIVFVVRKFI